MTPSTLERPALRTANGTRSVPKYKRLADDFRRRMKAGELVSGQQLPSFAVMRAEHGITQATLEQVYSLLEQDGLITRTKGRGTFVAQPKSRATSKVIGVVTEEVISQHPYYALVLSAIQQAARNDGLSVLLLYDAAMLATIHVDGLIVYDPRDEIVKKLPAGIPQVSIIFPKAEIASVVADDYEGSLHATNYLLSQGHRRIGFLTSGCQGNSDAASEERLQAYYDALGGAGVEVDPRFVYPLFGPWSPRQESDLKKRGYQRMTEWLREDWGSLGCTALMTQNDDVAMGAIEAFEDAGISVPSDVSVVGFDGTDFADHFRPRLTTVVVPLRRIGEAAVNQLEVLTGKPFGSAGPGEATGEDDVCRRILLPTEFRVGDSTGPAPAGR